VIIRAVPEGYSRQYAEITGEPPFCTFFDFDCPREMTCSGMVEMEIKSGKTGKLLVWLCRQHAEHMVAQLRECITMVDGADILG
jgi:hypothetical protein